VCEHLAHSRYLAAKRPGVELATSNRYVVKRGNRLLQLIFIVLKPNQPMSSVTVHGYAFADLLDKQRSRGYDTIQYDTIDTMDLLTCA